MMNLNKFKSITILLVILNLKGQMSMRKRKTKVVSVFPRKRDTIQEKPDLLVILKIL